MQGSLSAAARSLHLTQPAASRQLAALEREAGMRLVDRGARRARLTDAGAAPARHADAILGSVTAAEHELAALQAVDTGRVRSARSRRPARRSPSTRSAHFAPRIPQSRSPSRTRARTMRSRASSRGNAWTSGSSSARRMSRREPTASSSSTCFATRCSSRSGPATPCAQAPDPAGGCGRRGLDRRHLAHADAPARRDAGFELLIRYATDHSRIAHGLVARRDARQRPRAVGPAARSHRSSDRRRRCSPRCVGSRARGRAAITSRRSVPPGAAPHDASLRRILEFMDRMTARRLEARLGNHDRNRSVGRRRRICWVCFALGVYFFTRTDERA